MRNVGKQRARYKGPIGPALRGKYDTRRQASGDDLIGRLRGTLTPADDLSAQLNARPCAISDGNRHYRAKLGHSPTRLTGNFLVTDTLTASEIIDKHGRMS